MEAIEKFVGTVNSLVWGPYMLVLLVGTGLFLTLRLKFVSFRYLPYALKLAFSKNQDQTSQGDISHFQALMTALAATIGTGNIAGVATAVTLGGPGAVFWMWVTALVGMATKYAEAILAVKYRVVDENGEMAGGPMYFLEKGLNMRWLGLLFAFFGAAAGFGIGNMVQSNSVAAAIETTFKVPTWASGVVLAILTALVILGGIKSIGRVTALLVPFMAVFYILGGLVIIIMYISNLPQAIATILQAAFAGSQPIAGGFAGAAVAQAIRFGVARGVFSNEAGLGSAPIAAAAAKTDHPARQALVSMTGTFLDTIVVCSITGLVLTITGTWEMANPKTLTGAALTTAAFSKGLPGNWGGIIVSIGIILFAYSTILGWAYYGEKCAEYLLGTKAIKPYRYLWVIAVLVGAVAKLSFVWDLADTLNGLMAIPNLIGLLLLSGVVVSETKDFFENFYAKEQARG
ncbi:MAG: alanine/glycine:cation symporter family protein [Bacillota bacterium]|uniref:Amino acid carrier protein n=1 Tax=Thermanaerosceptrum fracticalcis TaxID=1712410 RepID=A0A7G6E0F7_THEFR|nr:sodium:alanine symporter family protein [Thermanaerosceptrum fracticalcis]QNB45561.1 amino acid carrier protein [Thermanaerosceptrum fracticalcis]